jgi:hypothetical protein
MTDLQGRLAEYAAMRDYEYYQSDYQLGDLIRSFFGSQKS